MEYFQHSLMRLPWVVVVVMLAVENGCNGCLEKERIALLQLKDSINFPNGSSLPSWEEEDNTDCCQWKGVECNSITPRVIKLELDGERDYRRIDGYWHLNASILLPFESLRSLKLSDNQLGSFVGNEGSQKESGILKKLEVLDLSGNYFDNSVWSFLGGLSSIKTLDLSYNRGLHEAVHNKDLRNLGNIETLLMDDAIFDDILPYIRVMTSIQVLSLKYCDSKRIPSIEGCPGLATKCGKQYYSSMVEEYILLS